MTRLTTLKKTAIIAVSSILWRLGGYAKAKWSGCRDTLIPIMFGLWFWYHFGLWWLFPTITGTYQIIRKGYGESSWLKKIFKRNDITRAAAGFLYSCAILPVIILYGFWLQWFIYLFINTFTNFMVVWLDLNDWTTELLVGGAVATIILMI